MCRVRLVLAKLTVKDVLPRFSNTVVPSAGFDKGPTGILADVMKRSETENGTGLIIGVRHGLPGPAAAPQCGLQAEIAGRLPGPGVAPVGLAAL